MRQNGLEMENVLLSRLSLRFCSAGYTMACFYLPSVCHVNLGYPDAGGLGEAGAVAGGPNQA